MIKAKLEKLCSKMPSNWKAQCTNFVEGEFQSILDLLVAEVKPEEICVMLNVCKPKSLSDSTTFRDTGKRRRIKIINNSNICSSSKCFSYNLNILVLPIELLKKLNFII